MKTYKTYSGVLEVFSEQGSHPSITIYNDKLKGVDPWSKTYFFNKKDKGKITVKGKDNEILYQGPWTYSRENTMENNYLQSPKEIEPKVWLEMIKTKCEIEYIKELETFNQDDMIIKSFLDTDLYKITMMQFAFHNSSKQRQQATYALKCRSGEKLGYLKEEIIEQIKMLKTLKFNDAEIEYLRDLDLFKEDFLSYLSYFSLNNVSFEVQDLEGELSVRATGPWDSSIIVEVPLLAIVQELHFSKSHKEENLVEARLNLKEKIKLIKGSDLKITDFGTRRRYSQSWQREVVETLVKEVPENIVGTSNIYIAKELGLKPVGTMAHEFFQAWQVLGTSFQTSQKEALYAWHQEYGEKLNVALTDILGTNVFLADCDKDLTEKYRGYRHDSGDPIEWGHRMLAHFHEMSVDAKDKSLIFSDGLNIPLAKKINKEFKGNTNVSFGIGTNLTNDFNSHKPLSLVMKLVQMNGKATIKVSDTPAKITCEDQSLIDETLSYIKKVVKYPRINLAVDALIENDEGKFLIIKRGDKDEAGFNKWAFPGGFLDYFETTEYGIKREIKEELGVEFFNLELIKVLQDPDRDPRGRIISFLFKGKVKGKIKCNQEVLEYKWVDKLEKNMSFDHKAVLREILNERKS